MSLTSDRNIESGYAAIRLLTDTAGKDSVPVGVIGWDAEREWYDLRVLGEDERVTGITKFQRKLLRVASKQMRHWAESGEVPYFREKLSPWSSTFWTYVSKSLNAGVRLDPPRALEPRITSGGELESLFDAVVEPKRKESVSRERINGKVSRALGEIAGRLKYNKDLSAFAGGTARVMRSLEGTHTTLIVDGVNLAGARARNDADALASRIRRIRKARPDRQVVSLIGYMASPNGLNGEKDMAEWLQEDTESKTFDLDRENEQFRNATKQALREALSELESQESFPFVSELPHRDREDNRSEDPDVQREPGRTG